MTSVYIYQIHIIILIYFQKSPNNNVMYVVVKTCSHIVFVISWFSTRLLIFSVMTHQTCTLKYVCDIL